jgi:hypothetical protein
MKNKKLFTNGTNVPTVISENSSKGKTRDSCNSEQQIKTNVLELRRRFQIEGFSRCISIFCKVNRLRWEPNSIFHHLQQQMVGIKLDQLASVFKLSLATFFSKEMSQELPKDCSNAVFLFPNNILRRLRSHYVNTHRRAKILWDLMQSKVISNEIDDSVIDESYRKHRKVLSTMTNTPLPVLESLRSYAREFAAEVQKQYDGSTTLAPQKGYLGFPRNKGGCRKAYEGNLKFQGGLRRLTTKTRIDPCVLFLTGPPGVGKSFIIRRITNKLCKMFGYNYDNSYSRSIATDHWDGYRNQLVTVIDDIFTSAIRRDEEQLIQICSNIDTVLPMADLRDKGKKFTSEFLLLSSNSTVSSSSTIRDVDALHRRISPMFKISAYDRVTRIYSVDQQVWRDGMIISIKCLKLNIEDLESLLIDHLMNTYFEHLESLEKLDDRTYAEIFQPIQVAKIGEYGYGYKIPSRPSPGLPKCRTCAIPEPLKIRMITKGETETWALKPVQRAMFRALGKFEIFKLTRGEHIDLYQLDLKKPFLVSGDYESATDNLHFDVTQIMIEELVKVLPKNMSERIKKEGGRHIIEYPKETGLPDLLQTNGQLMGSLLSFPLLCIANACTIGMVQKAESLHDIKALINGDDILFASHLRGIKSWKKVSNSMGLIPSIGKNYISGDWCTVNSQLLVRDGCKWSVQPTGKFRCLYRKPDDPLTVTEALKVFDKSLVVHMAKKQLKLTPQSVDISYRYGGLGLENTREPTRSDMEIYMFLFLRKKTTIVATVEDKCLIKAPRDILTPFLDRDPVREGIKRGQFPPPKSIPKQPMILDLQQDEVDNQIFDWIGFKKFKKFYKTVPQLREYAKAGKFGRPLNSSKLMEAWVNREIVEFIPNHNLI